MFYLGRLFITGMPQIPFFLLIASRKKLIYRIKSTYLKIVPAKSDVNNNEILEVTGNPFGYLLHNAGLL